MGSVKRVKRSGGWARRFERKARWARRRKKCSDDRFAIFWKEVVKSPKIKVSF